MSATAFHLSLNVANLEMSVGFYRLLFGVDPVKWFPDYAKFELVDPPLVLALEPTPPGVGGAMNHFGLRVSGTAAIDAVEARLTAVGATVQRLEEVVCCYSRQKKIVVSDPDGTLVEIYAHLGDEERKGLAGGKGTATEKQSSTATVPATSWEHLVGTLMPDRIPHDSGSLGEVRLRGTFNRREGFFEAATILAEAKRSLLPGGSLLVHLLAADEPLTMELPELPPPADQVRYAPAIDQVLSAVEAAGFHFTEVRRLSHAPVLQLGPIGLRELLLVARKPSVDIAGGKKSVVYVGPFSKMEDDGGRVYARGRKTEVGDAELAWLDSNGWLEKFVVLT